MLPLKQASHRHQHLLTGSPSSLAHGIMFCKPAAAKQQLQQQLAGRARKQQKV
jgi:hypothetical protein